MLKTIKSVFIHIVLTFKCLLTVKVNGYAFFPNFFRSLSCNMVSSWGLGSSDGGYTSMRSCTCMENEQKIKDIMYAHAYILKH